MSLTEFYANFPMMKRENKKCFRFMRKPPNPRNIQEKFGDVERLFKWLVKSAGWKGFGSPQSGLECVTKNVDDYGSSWPGDSSFEMNFMDEDEEADMIELGGGSEGINAHPMKENVFGTAHSSEFRNFNAVYHEEAMKAEKPGKTAVESLKEAEDLRNLIEDKFKKEAEDAWKVRKAEEAEEEAEKEENQEEDDEDTAFDEDFYREEYEDEEELEREQQLMREEEEVVQLQREYHALELATSKTSNSSEIDDFLLDFDKSAKGVVKLKKPFVSTLEEPKVSKKRKKATPPEKPQNCENNEKVRRLSPKIVLPKEKKQKKSPQQKIIVFDAEAALKNVFEYCRSGAKPNIFWVESFDDFAKLKSYFKAASSAESVNLYGVHTQGLKLPSFACLSCMFEDGATSLRWNKKLMAARATNGTFQARFPNPVCYVLSLAFISDGVDEILWHHYVLPMKKEDDDKERLIEAFWKFLMGIVASEKLHLASDGPLVSFNLQATIRPILQRNMRLVCSMNDLLDPCVMGWLLQPQVANMNRDIDYLYSTYVTKLKSPQDSMKVFNDDEIEERRDFESIAMGGSPSPLSSTCSPSIATHEIEEWRSAFWEKIFEDAEHSADIVLEQRDSIEASGLTEALVYQEIPTAAMLALLDCTGLCFDPNVLISHGRTIQAEMKSLELQVKAIAGSPAFLITSPLQVSKLLFDQLRLVIPPVASAMGVSKRKPKTSHKSTNDQVLQLLKHAHPVVELIQRYRQLSKLYNTYIEQLKPLEDAAATALGGASIISSSSSMLADKNPNKLAFKVSSKFWNKRDELFPAISSSESAVLPRIYTQWNHVMTVTGRLSSSNPNFQAIPKNQAIPHLHQVISCRNAFIVDESLEDSCLISVDYCQIEMRLLAHFCEAGALRTLFSNSSTLKKGGLLNAEDFDIYREMAAIYLKTSVGAVSDKLRQAAKVTCLALIYGSGVPTLAKQMGVDFAEASKFRSEFLKFFQEVPKYITQTIEAARKSGCVSTIQGRLRYLPGINSSSPAERAEAERHAINTTIQGSASDLIKNSMLKVQRAILSRDWGEARKMPRILLTMHDELVLECPRKHLHDLADMLVESMTTGYNFNVPLSISLKYGRSWGSLKPMDA